MQTLPCGHRVVCRKCFIRTIQSAIADHSLPLKCIVCRANVLKLGSCKADKSLSSQSSLSSSATPSRSSRRPASSVATRIPQSKGTAAGGGAASRALTVGPGITSADHPMSRSYDVGRPPEISSTAARFRESSSHRASHRGCCHHHQIPLRQLNAQQDAAGAAKITKLQPLPIYPAQGSAPTQRRAFSSTAAAAPAEASSSTADAKDCATSSAVRAALIGHRAS